MWKKFLNISLSLLILMASPLSATANSHTKNDDLLYLFKSMQILTDVPWYYLAAINQFEKNLRHPEKKKEKKSLKYLSIQIPKEVWAGILNPDPDDKNPESIKFFQGIGRDGDGDQKADWQNDTDVLYSIAVYLAMDGTGEDQIRTKLWDYYKHPVSVDVITHIAKIYQKFDTLDLDQTRFPIPLEYNYTYHNTWGDRRGWGGLRIHEGTDIFANYGTPVLSTCYGYIELIGWNRYGGWRVGIRDIRNNYHYFAHLNHFRKGLKKGDIVKPGDQIGTVGSSGYGPKGTSGKFPPHLHYGIYRFNGRNTYSFDPYPLLKKWEREAYKQKRQKKKKQKQSKSRNTIRWVD
ncbi:M23 family metallopeptidase [Thermoactinomyces mirandus]|uniref:M23 family metallopeptidase n=1 Tax=Thermoactinomyces mirandus TaxID=2756294 RepID=A0A7W1XTA2_9BACL|nr:M23 family metallopeptidase [Thermoactinomyces mirandus]MBA4602776.1 M23 family metallopeptidase [Thermoactinomyces mirandus]